MERKLPYYILYFVSFEKDSLAEPRMFIHQAFTHHKKAMKVREDLTTGNENY